MLSHEFLTIDHALQRTSFTDGTEVVVNFGAEPRTAQIGGRSDMLPQHGFAAVGPDLTVLSELVDGQPVTTIQEQ